MRQHDGLAPALAPHVHLTTLGLSGRRVRGMTGGDLYNPVETKRGRSAADRGGNENFTRADLSPLFLAQDLDWTQLVTLVAGAQLSVCVGAPRVEQTFVC